MPPGGWTLVKGTVISSLISIQFGWLLRFSIGIVFTKDYVRNLKPRSLLRSWAHQCPQRHQGSDGNVLVIHQLFLRERQRFHNGSCLVLGLRVDQEDDAFAIAARIPLADFPVEVELHSCPNL